MAARLALLAPRLIVLVVIWLLAAASWTLAAGGPPTSPATTTAAGAGEPAKPEVLVVPDVRGQTYVFAKGILQDAGFAWKVEGSVEGYAANVVASQNPAPGARVADNGAPVVVVTLKRGEYAERGLPENTSPYEGTQLVLISDWEVEQAETAATPTTEAAPPPSPTTTAAAPTAPAPTQPATPRQKQEGSYRQPDFAVPGAPGEPADEMPLPRRAERLQHKVAALSSKPGPAFVRHWLYQHAWIVTGAGFGWRNGDDALRTLVQVDRSLHVRFGFGARSERVARRTLAWVESLKG
jgi:PASTA domain